VARAEEVLLSVIVAGELLAGFRSGSRYDDNLRALQTLVKDPSVKVLQISWNTAEIFGRIASALRARSTPIPTNDIWQRTLSRPAPACSPRIDTSAT
jgi:predicted nucleic acid-binding protein